MNDQWQAEERRIKKNQYSKMYRASHKDEIAKQRNVRTTCSCGLEVSKRNLEEHRRSNNHATSFAELISLVEEKTNPDVAKYIAGFIE